MAELPPARVVEFLGGIPPGYRVYYGRDGEDLVVRLAGGTKKCQTHDIQTAHALWKAYRQEKRHARQSP